MSSALKSGRGIRYYPSKPGGNKPPECAGIYYIYDENGNFLYTGQAVNLRRRVYTHKRNGKIPQGGYVDCFRAKEGITYAELDETERLKINRYNPPLNQRKGGGGRKSPILNKHSETDEKNIGIVTSDGQISEPKRKALYRLLGYERVDSSGEIHYKREPKALFFLVLELVVKILLFAGFLSIVVGVCYRILSGTIINRYLLIGNVALPILGLILFGYIRRNRVFSIMAIITIIAALSLYIFSYFFNM